MVEEGIKAEKIPRAFRGMEPAQVVASLRGMNYYDVENLASKYGVHGRDVMHKVFYALNALSDPGRYGPKPGFGEPKLVSAAIELYGNAASGYRFGLAFRVEDPAARFEKQIHKHTSDFAHEAGVKSAAANYQTFMGNLPNLSRNNASNFLLAVMGPSPGEAVASCVIYKEPFLFGSPKNNFGSSKPADWSKPLL